MNDRELLELAAKAAGISKAPEGDNFDNPTFEDERTEDFYLRNDGEFWMPLEDDGDALRLAVKLQIQVTPGTYNANEFMAFHAGIGEANEFRSYQQDDFASMRRAIVRAAAEIGRRTL